MITDEIQSHLQSMFYLLRPQDTIKIVSVVKAWLLTPQVISWFFFQVLPAVLFYPRLRVWDVGVVWVVRTDLNSFYLIISDSFISYGKPHVVVCAYSFKMIAYFVKGQVFFMLINVDVSLLTSAWYCSRSYHWKF